MDTNRSVFYRIQRDKGKPHSAAIAGVQWLHLWVHCWQNRGAYDEAKEVAAWRRKGSAIVNWLSL
ncbi:MAG: hypothetical protein HC769_22500 [Cyanobacteria bacterium CRU_2_1]|nr:hypothetical protein [Cyanobacteria bacterium RU_5_0]NJR61358.1 hypothetical protein [Cyanobacteria bacterium CRU_2_1]